MYCPQHPLRVPTLPCRNNIVRFLCCLKMKFAHELGLCWQTTKQCQSHKIVLISLPAMFNMHWWTRYASLSGDLTWAYVNVRCVFLTTDQLAYDLDVFGVFEQILDVCCPASSPLYRLSQFSWLDNQQLDVSISYLEILLSSALSPNLYEYADYRSDYGPKHSSAPLL